MAEKPDPLIGMQLGDYVIQSLIGRGGMARVYEGYDEKLGRKAAVKVMEVEHDQGDELTQRFVREARAAANLEHANIVHVYQFGEAENMYYMAMKLVDGKTLLNILKRQRQQKKFLESEHVLNIVSQIGSALDYAHSKGVIHRDIKPSNIMLTEDNRAILTDFGLTMKIDSDTTMGTAFGTPRYISPEQAIASHKAVPQSDIYSLGIVLYEMVTNQTPFDSDSPMTLALSHITNKPPLPQSIRADLPHPVQTVILKALEKRPEQRWQTAAEMSEALKEAYQGKEPNVELSQEVLELPSPAAASLGGAGFGASSSTVSSSDSAAKLSGTPGSKAQIVSKNNTNSPKAAAQTGPSSAAQPSSRRTFLRILTIFLLMFLAAVVGTVLGKSADNTAIALVATESPVPTNTPTPARVRLIYSNDSLIIYNATDQAVSLEGYTFVRSDATGIPFDASRFGDRTHRNLGAGQCLRIKMRNADDKAIPFTCGAQTKPLIFDDPIIVFWSPHDEKDSITTFLVTKKGSTVQTCSMRVNTCEFPVS